MGHRGNENTHDAMPRRIVRQDRCTKTGPLSFAHNGLGEAGEGIRTLDVQLGNTGLWI